MAFLVLTDCQSPGPALAGDDDEARIILFSGRDLWRNGVFGYGGLLVAPGGFEQDGIIFKLLLSGGLYRYRSVNLGNEDVIGTESQTQILPGARVKRGNAEFKLFFGPEWQTHRLRPDDTANRLRGQSFGLRFAGELWYEPRPLTLITADAALSTIDTSHSGRLAFGWRVADRIFNGEGFYVGPEGQTFGADGYRHWRLGFHITSLKTDGTEWSAADGFARDSDGNASPYVRLNVSARIGN